ncbi:MAG: response regulator transcription factor [Verrucomicrobiota bacterium]|nr:response regulator transcription factor [Verrucomicrobiota bacterium]
MGARHWRERLLRRGYPFPASGAADDELAALIGHAGVEYYFPLGASDPEAAARKAQTIHRMAVKEGWQAVCRQFSRELMLGFEWCANPLLWTYTTIHTLVRLQTETKPDPGNARVLVVESDAGIRRALVWCLNHQPGFSGVSGDSGKAFAAAVAKHQPRLVLLNRSLAGQVGFEVPGQLAPLGQDMFGLTYSVAVDGDRLFVSTPGGAAGYLLKRVRPEKLLEPILDAAGRLDFAAGDLPGRVKAYFKGLLQPRPDPDAAGSARLTPREHEVLALLSKGRVDKEIATALGISVWTVHGHVKKIFERLQVRTRTEAAVRYLEK